MVYVEFLMAFFPVFILFVGVAQLAMLFGGRLLVHHAAVRASRSAVVVVDDDPRYYGGEERGVLSGREATADDLLSVLSRGGVGARSGELRAGLARPSAPSRRSEIQLSAAVVLLPLADRGDATIAGAIGSDGLREQAAETMRRLRVTFPGHEVDPVEPDGLVRVRVEYRYPCSVPLARRIICTDGGTSKTYVSEMRLPAHTASFEYEGWTP